MTLTPDPLQGIDINEFYYNFRSGSISSEQVTRAYLDRIEALDGKLGAFEYVDAEKAMVTARAMDRLRTAGVDLGPMMGLPISVKDLFTVHEMPITVGTNIEVADLVDPEEGPFIRALHRTGCVILGKTRMVEFSLGIAGVSAPRGTPWNPCDMERHRLPGGSSSGAGVSVAAGLCALAIGTDSGGSVRVPAALCGVFGLKTTFGLWPTTGVFPLLSEIDSIGLITRSARDAAVAYAQITEVLHGKPVTFSVKHLSRLRFGRPSNYFFKDLSSVVDSAVKAACSQLQAAGVVLDPLEIPQVAEREEYFPLSMPASLIAILGRDRFLANKDKMDAVVASRADGGLEANASDYLALEKRRHQSSKKIADLFDGFDAWITPTTTEIAPTLEEFKDIDKGLALALGMTRNTQPANYFGLCAASLPLSCEASDMPIGLQLICPAGSDADLLAIAMVVEEITGSGTLAG